MRSICREDDMPDRTTVYDWYIHNVGEVVDGDTIIEHGFPYHYDRAREVGIDEMFDETIEISDDGTNDYVEREGRNGTFIAFDKEAVLRSRLRMDARHKYIENMMPRKYGKNLKVQSQQLDGDGNSIDPVGMVPDGLDEFLSVCAEAVKKAMEKDDQ